MKDEKEDLTMGDGSPNLVHHNGGPIKSTDVVNSTVESSEFVKSEENLLFRGLYTVKDGKAICDCSSEY